VIGAVRKASTPAANPLPPMIPTVPAPEAPASVDPNIKVPLVACGKK